MKPERFRSFAARPVPYMLFCAVTFVCAQVIGAEAPDGHRSKISFQRECKRLASDVSVTNAAQTISPRASPASPLQQPPHPPLARSRGEEGTVVMNLFVTETGEVAEAHLATSSGYSELDSAAMQATQRWRLAPGTIGGIPVCMWVKFAVVFSLSAGNQQQNVTRPFAGFEGPKPARPKE
jgi:TonB family protein